MNDKEITLGDTPANISKINMVLNDFGVCRPQMSQN